METPVILVLVGVTGDLSRRKLLKAIANIGKKEEWPGKNSQFKILGVTRQEGITVDSLVEGFAEDTGAVEFLKNHLEIFSMDVSATADYQKLSEKLNDMEKEFGASGDGSARLFYLSIPAQASEQVIEHLGSSGLAKVLNTKLMMEKPFGSDYESAQALIKNISRYFTPEQVYRVDHYLAKGIAEEIIKAKDPSANAKKISVLASEKIGVEGRGNFYEQTGALRDLVQSHLLQLTALTIMQPNQNANSTQGSEIYRANMSLPARRLGALKTLSLPSDKPLSEYVTRGQYKGYREEVKNTESMTETFVSLTLHSSEPHLSGVPIILTTGKNLAEKKTEVRIEAADEHAEKIGQGVVFTEHDAYDAYEKIFLNAVRGNTDLFVTDEEVLECWRIIKPILAFWKEDNHQESSDLHIYDPGWEG